MSKHHLNILTKISSVLMACFMIGFTSDAFARRTPEFTYNEMAAMPISCSIYRDQASINKICAGDSKKKALSILGTPKNISKDGTYHYDGLSIKFADFGGDGNYIVYNIDSNSNNYSTIDGVQVGMPESVLSDIYGTADVVYIEKYVAPKLSEEKNEKYRKKSETVYTYYATPAITLSFVVRNGVISKLNVHLSD